MAYEVKIEKVIAKPVQEVFRSLSEGLLFMNCGADSSTIKIDFRVGGKYHIDFKNHKVFNFGEFLEIVPDRKIVFNWCQIFGADQKPDTLVTVELFPDGTKTRLVLLHTGFKDKGNCDDHYQGWNGGLVDMIKQLQEGCLRFVRQYEAPVERLFEACQNPESFFGFMGDISRGTVDFRVGGKYQVPTEKGEVKGAFLEIDPNKKMVLSWLSGCAGPLSGSKVTLLFRKGEKSGSILELIHDGLSSAYDQKMHRTGWEHVTTKISETL